MGKGIVVVFVCCAVLLGLFGLACYLMTEIDPPPLDEEEKQREVLKAHEDDSRRLSKVEETTCFPLSNISVTIAPLVTVTTENSSNLTTNNSNLTTNSSNLSTNATAKERRSIQSHPWSDSRKSRVVIMEIADDEGSPRFEMIFYPKRSMKQRIWRGMGRAKEFGELQSEGLEGIAAETGDNSVIRILPDDTITLEESDKTMAIESTEKRSNNEAQFLLKSIVNGSGYEMPISENITKVNVDTKVSAPDDSNIQNVQNQGPPSDSPDDLENILSKFAGTEAPISTESSTSAVEPSGFDIKVPLSTGSSANSPETSAGIHDLGAQMSTSLVSATSDSDAEPLLSTENATSSVTDQDIETQQASPSTTKTIEHLTVSVSADKSDEVTATKEADILDVSTKGNADEQLTFSTTSTTSDVDTRLTVELIETGVDSKNEGVMVTNSIFKD